VERSSGDTPCVLIGQWSAEYYNVLNNSDNAGNCYYDIDPDPRNWSPPYPEGVGMRHSLINACHHQSNGLIKRFHSMYKCASA
jgi:hypothetical protein